MTLQSQTMHVVHRIYLSSVDTSVMIDDKYIVFHRIYLSSRL